MIARYIWVTQLLIYEFRSKDQISVDCINWFLARLDSYIFKATKGMLVNALALLGDERRGKLR